MDLTLYHAEISQVLQIIHHLFNIEGAVFDDSAVLVTGSKGYLERKGTAVHKPSIMEVIENDEVIAFSMGARMNEQYYDVCFEKAYSAINGAYAMINREFSRMIAEKYPEVRFLNREDDMGSEGLRRAKESYQPTVLLEKYTADWKES